MERAVGAGRAVGGGWGAVEGGMLMDGIDEEHPAEGGWSILVRGAYSFMNGLHLASFPRDLRIGEKSKAWVSSGCRKVPTSYTVVVQRTCRNG